MVLGRHATHLMYKDCPGHQSGQNFLGNRYRECSTFQMGSEQGWEHYLREQKDFM